LGFAEPQPNLRFSLTEQYCNARDVAMQRLYIPKINTKNP
jgi:hypothetical protein